MIDLVKIKLAVVSAESGIDRKHCPPKEFWYELEKKLKELNKKHEKERWVK